MGVVTKTLKDHSTKVRRAEAEYHRGQSIVERFNKTLAERLFGYQYWKEFRFSRAGSEIGNGRRDSPRSSRH